MDQLLGRKIINIRERRIGKVSLRLMVIRERRYRMRRRCGKR